MASFSEHLTNIIAAEKSGFKSKGVLMVGCTSSVTPSPVEMADLKAENKRLREALVRIADEADFSRSHAEKLLRIENAVKQALKGDE